MMSGIRSIRGIFLQEINFNGIFVNIGFHNMKKQSGLIYSLEIEDSIYD